MRRLVVVLALFAATVGSLAGCQTLKKTVKPDLPPTAFIFVQGPVDTVNHNIHLYWYGSDPDGWVVGYEMRLLNPLAPADTQWAFVTKTDSVFAVFTPTGYAAPTLEVRAIDNVGLKTDPPASQSFQFRNLPPTVTFINRFGTRDTTFASATAEWAASDPDGDGTKLRFRIWLDGNAAHPDLVAGSSYTIPSDRFLQSGQYLSGWRWMYIQAIDDGGMASTIDSTRWYVSAPASGGHRHPGRLLIVDDYPALLGLKSSTDSLFNNTAIRNLAPGQWSVMHLWQVRQSLIANPFRSSKDVEQTFEQFDAVVWYIAGVNNLNAFETTLQSYQDGMAAYLQAGGNVYLEGTDLVDAAHASGPLTPDFMTGYLGSDYLMTWWHGFSAPNEGFVDSTAGWGNTSPSYFVTTWGDTLRAGQLSKPTTSTGSLRVFGIRDASYGLLWALPVPYKSLNVPDPPAFIVPVAVSVPQPSGGRMILNTLPLRAASGSPAPYANVPRFLAHVFQQLGLTGP